MDYYESINRYLMMKRQEEERRNMKEMERYFIERTKKHVNRVQDFLEMAGEFFPSLAKELEQRGKKHDATKYSVPERKPYILLTWKYKMKKEGVDIPINDEESESIRNVTFHHCKNNPHHPEYWDKTLQKNPVNFEDRDKPSGIIVNSQEMDDISLLEMVADWSAMSDELGENNPRKFADKVIGIRWDFSDEQKEFIYEAIKSLWGDK